ncbi:MAG: hypothetical protein IPN38_03970 [Flavobacteriales bacterium]|nr:hypothetical protein [Flavobacteriales bacterium]
MLKELMRSNLGNVSFEEVRLQEALNYLDNAIRINETGINRQVERRAEEIHIQQKALELQARKSGKAMRRIQRWRGERGRGGGGLG